MSSSEDSRRNSPSEIKGKKNQCFLKGKLLLKGLQLFPNMLESVNCCDACAYFDVFIRNVGVSVGAACCHGIHDHSFFCTVIHFFIAGGGVAAVFHNGYHLSQRFAVSLSNGCGRGLSHFYGFCQCLIVVGFRFFQRECDAVGACCPCVSGQRLHIFRRCPHHWWLHSQRCKPDNFPEPVCRFFRHSGKKDIQKCVMSQYPRL